MTAGRRHTDNGQHRPRGRGRAGDDGRRGRAGWKGTTTDKIYFSFQPDGKLYGTWSGEVADPQALTLGFPQISGIRATLFTVWTGKSGTRLWYAESGPPL